MAKFDYRKFYKDYYGIEFDGRKFEVHHIDLDRENNDIKNLILLPKNLHKKYHDLLPYVQSLVDDKSVKTIIDMNNGQTLYYDEMKEFCELMIEINSWKCKKAMNDLRVANKEISKNW